MKSKIALLSLTYSLIGALFLMQANAALVAANEQNPVTTPVSAPIIEPTPTPNPITSPIINPSPKPITAPIINPSPTPTPSITPSPKPGKGIGRKKEVSKSSNSGQTTETAEVKELPFRPITAAKPDRIAKSSANFFTKILNFFQSAFKK